MLGQNPYGDFNPMGQGGDRGFDPRYQGFREQIPLDGLKFDFKYKKEHLVLSTVRDQEQYSEKLILDYVDQEQNIHLRNGASVGVESYRSNGQGDLLQIMVRDLECQLDNYRNVKLMPQDIDENEKKQYTEFLRSLEHDPSRNQYL